MTAEKMPNGRVLICPAALKIDGGCSVRCRIEQHTIDGRTEGESIRQFCTGQTEQDNNHYQCPSWQSWKDQGLMQPEVAKETRERMANEVKADEDILQDALERGWIEEMPGTGSNGVVEQ